MTDSGRLSGKEFYLGRGIWMTHLRLCFALTCVPCFDVLRPLTHLVTGRRREREAYRLQEVGKSKAEPDDNLVHNNHASSLYALWSINGKVRINIGKKQTEGPFNSDNHQESHFLSCVPVVVAHNMPTNRAIRLIPRH